MARTRDRRSRRRADSDLGSLKGWLGFFGAVAFFGVGGWQLYEQMSGRSDLDKQLCPVEGEKSLTAVVVDLTDPLTIAQKQDFLNQLERTRNEVPKYGRLTLFKVDATRDHLLEPILDLCNPGDGSDVTEANGNPKRDRERWEAGFSQPLEKAFEELTKASGAAESPIFQSVQSVTLTKLQRPNAAGKPKKLILVSDLLENYQDLNFYRHVPTLEELRQSPSYRVNRPDLKGVDTEIWMLTRPTTTKPRTLAELWMHAFKDEGAVDVRAHNIR